MVRSMKFILLVICVMFASCDSTIHFYPDDGVRRSQIRINVDWSDYGKTEPTGMTVMCHHSENGEKVLAIDNNISYVTPYLSAGRHWATVFNLTEDEYNNIGFRGLDSVKTAEVYAPEYRGTMWYTGRGDDNSYVAGQPEWLAVDTIMTDHVEYPAEEVKLIGTLHPKNIIFTLHVTLRTTYIGNLRSARGAITGLANGRMIHSDTTNDNSVTVTHLIESDSWSRTRTYEPADIGYVTADVRCFGLPSNHKGLPDENILEFQAMLAEGQKVLKYNIPVGHLIRKGNIPEGMRGDNLDLYLDLWLDPPLPPGGNGNWGFDVWVEDWDEQEDVIIPV